MDALTFPVVIQKCIAPDTNLPEGGHKVRYKPFSFKLLKEPKQSVIQYGPSSPYTMGLLKEIIDENRLIPVEWNTLAKICLSSCQFLQFKTWWIDGTKIQDSHNQTHNIDVTKYQLLGDGDWTKTQHQLKIKNQTLAQLTQICLIT